GKVPIADAERTAGRSITFVSALEDLASLLHRIALAQAGVAPADDEPDRDRVATLAARLDRGNVQVMYQVALLGRRDLPLAPDEFAGFSMAILRMVAFAAGSGASQVSSSPSSSRAAMASAPARTSSA